MSLATLLVAVVDCDKTAAVALLVIAHLFIGLGAGCDVPIASELSKRFPTTLFALTNGAAVLPGVVAPELVGLVLEAGPDLRHQWQITFYISAAITACSVLIFCTQVRAEREPWDYAPDELIKVNEPTKSDTLNQTD